jgi:hypothetical protein
MGKKMKKVLFLTILPFLLLGTASVNAQVRIGGNTEPNPVAILDLNESDSEDGTKALALPRVSLGALSGNDANLDGKTPLSGMLVYNTNTALGTGIYYWDGTTWFKVSTGSLAEGDGIIGNEITNVTADGGLEKTGGGTVSSPYSVGIKTGGVTTTHILDGTIANGDLAANAVTSATITDGEVTSADIKDATIATADLANGAVTAPILNRMGASAGQVLVYSGSAWVPTTPAGTLGAAGAGRIIAVSRAASMPFELDGATYYIPIACKKNSDATGAFSPAGSVSAAGQAYSIYPQGSTCMPSDACTCLFQTF